MSPDVPVKPRRFPVAQLALALVILLALGAFLLRGIDPHHALEQGRAAIDRGIAFIRAAGPGMFFCAMAILPAFGIPMIAFSIPAGEAFASRMTMPGVVAVSLLVLAVNLALAYWVARYALRPLLTRLLKRYGYNVPCVTPANALNVALLVRLTPGPTYAMQAFILGIAEVPFRLYMIVSWLAVTPWVLGGIILGKGMLNGNFKVVIAGLGVLVVAVIGVQWLRRKYAKRES